MSESPLSAQVPARARRWRRRLGIGIPASLAVALAALFGAHRWWAITVHRELRATIEAYVSAGQPIYPQDFVVEPVPDEENAAKPLAHARECLNLAPHQVELIRTLALNPASHASYANQITEIVEANAEALRLLRRAASLPGVDWDTRLDGLILNTLVNSLADRNRLGELLCADVIHHHKLADHAEAVECLADLLALAKAIDRGPFLVSHLRGCQLHRFVAAQVEQVAPHLMISDHAARGRIETLVAGLTDDQELQAGLVRGFHWERMMQLDTVQRICRGERSIESLTGPEPGWPPTFWERISLYLLQPAFERDALRMIMLTSAWAEAALEPTYPAARPHIPPDLKFDTWLDEHIPPLSSALLPAFQRGVTLHFLSLAVGRMAGTALGLRLYELDHGQRPESLAQLVPRYLNGIPADPFAEGERPIAYHPSADPPVLYSVGPNAIDEEGSFVTQQDGTVDWRAADIPFFLHGRPHQPQAKRPQDVPR